MVIYRMGKEMVRASSIYSMIRKSLRGNMICELQAMAAYFLRTERADKLGTRRRFEAEPERKETWKTPQDRIRKSPRSPSQPYPNPDTSASNASSPSPAASNPTAATPEPPATNKHYIHTDISSQSDANKDGEGFANREGPHDGSAKCRS